MKNLIFFLLTLPSLVTFGQRYVAGYEVAKQDTLRAIPVEYINAARTNLHVAYQHSSHGTHVSYGVFGLQDFKTGDDVLFGITNDDPTPDKLDFHDHAIPGANDLGDPNETAFLSTTRDYLDDENNSEINVVMWSWCDITGHQITVNYLPGMRNLIDEYGPGGSKIGTGPGQRATPVTFIFMTGHGNPNANWEDGYPGNQAQTIIDSCEEWDQFCLDYFSIDAHDMNDNYWADAGDNGNSEDYGGNFYWDYEDTHTLGTDYYENKNAPGGDVTYGEHNDQHITANRKAYAMWYILARIAGWDGSYGSSYLVLSKNSLNVGSAANSTGSFTITSDVSWTITDNQGWLTVNPTSGSNNHSVTVTASANNTASSRSATVTVTGNGMSAQYVTVTQTAPTFINVSDDDVELDGNTAATVIVAVTSNINWTVQSEALWLTVDPASGSGNDTLYISAEENTSIDERTGNVTLSGTGVSNVTIRITQPGATPFLIPDADTLYVDSDAGSTASLDISSNVEWETGSNENWLVADPDNGTGNGTISVEAAENPDTFPRIATLSLSADAIYAPINVIVVQAGAPYLSVPFTEVNIDSDEGSDGLFLIYSNRSWSISYEADWFSIDYLNGTNDADIHITAHANTSDTNRVDTVIVSSPGLSPIIITVTQTAGSYLILSENYLDLDALNGSTASFDITSNVAWTISNIDNWLSPDNTSDSGNAIITVTATANTTGTSRSNEIYVTSEGLIPKYVYISQAALITTGITEEPGITDSFYPNPVVNFMNIELAKEELPATLSVFNLSGECIRKNEIHQTSTEVDLSILQPGVYLMQIVSPSHSIGRKIIKQ